MFFFLTEFQKIAVATAIGFCIMGFIGFFVKLIHIPINNIIVYVYYFLFFIKFNIIFDFEGFFGLDDLSITRMK